MNRYIESQISHHILTIDSIYYTRTWTKFITIIIKLRQWCINLHALKHYYLQHNCRNPRLLILQFCTGIDNIANTFFSIAGVLLYCFLIGIGIGNTV